MSAPSSSGCWKSGVAKTLSTTSLAPALWAISATAAMSMTSSVGLVGLSRKKALVFLRAAFFHCSEVVAVDQRRGDAVARQQVLDDVAARAEQRLGRDHMVAGLEPGEEDRGDRGHAAGGRARGLGALQEPHALLEHGDGRVGVARIDEARLVALEAPLGLLGAVVDVALGHEHRLGVLAELRAQRSAVDELGRRPQGRPSALRLAPPSSSPSPDNKKPGRECRTGFAHSHPTF